MKKILSVIVSLVLIICFCVTGVAVDTDRASSQTYVEYFEDCSYLTITIEEEKSLISTFAANTKKGSKTITYTDSNDEAQWTATVKGTFAYTGTTAMCTASSITYTVSNDNWKITSATASKTMNKAVGNVTAKKYTLGVPVKTVEETVTLICSASGVLS